MKHIFFAFMAVFAIAAQCVDAQNYPPGSWVRQVTPQNMPRQNYQQNYSQPSGGISPRTVRLVNTATIDAYGQQHPYADTPAARPREFQFGNGMVTVVMFPGTGLEQRTNYQFSHRNGTDYVYYGLGRDFGTGGTFLNQSLVLVANSDASVINQLMMNPQGQRDFTWIFEQDNGEVYQMPQGNTPLIGDGLLGTGGGSGGYSSGGTSTSPRQSTTQRCPACRGTGRCLNCNGTGWYQPSHTSNQRARCGCGNGQCRSCHGTGQR